jgi:uncharacterized protein (TIGR02246 family)
MSDANTLLQIEAIKKLKARYFRCIDTKDWNGMREVYARDAVMNDEESRSLWHGREEIVAGLEHWLSQAITVHHGHMPEIELTGPGEARGIWSMFDLVDHPEFRLEGHGHYHERYVIEDGAWRIAELRLSRLRVTRTPK